MMKEFQDEVIGIIGGKDFNNLRYVDDAVFLTDKESELQNISTRVNKTCKNYGMN